MGIVRRKSKTRRKQQERAEAAILFPDYRQSEEPLQKSAMAFSFRVLDNRPMRTSNRDFKKVRA